MRCAALLSMVLLLATSGCGSITPADPDGNGGSRIDANTPADAAPGNDGGPCGQCDPSAMCDPEASDPCVCPPGYAGDGTACTDVVSTLHGRRVEVPCVGPGTNELLCESDLDPVADPPWTGTAGGDPGARYRVVLYIRGVVERTEYVDGAREKDAFLYVGGRPAEDDDANVYRLRIGVLDDVTDRTDYYLNAGDKDGKGGHAWLLDYEATVTVRPGDGLLFETTDGDDAMIQNIDALKKGETEPEPIYVEGVSPYPDFFDGQFVQLDVVSVEPEE